MWECFWETSFEKTENTLNNSDTSINWFTLKSRLKDIALMEEKDPDEWYIVCESILIAWWLAVKEHLYWPHNESIPKTKWDVVDYKTRERLSPEQIEEHQRLTEENRKRTC